MPGPDGPWGDLLVRAVADGSVSEEVIDDKVVRLLRLARRVGALGDSDDRPAATAPGLSRAGEPARPAATTLLPRSSTTALLRAAAAASFVLLRNPGNALPLDIAAATSLAVIGPNALYPVVQGGGSAGVIPVSVAAPAEALRAALPEQRRGPHGRRLPDLAFGTRAVRRLAARPGHR